MLVEYSLHNGWYERVEVHVFVYALTSLLTARGLPGPAGARTPLLPPPTDEKYMKHNSPLTDPVYVYYIHYCVWAVNDCPSVSTNATDLTAYTQSPEDAL